MAIRKPIVISATGQMEELPSTDTLIQGPPDTGGPWVYFENQWRELSTYDLAPLIADGVTETAVIALIGQSNMVGRKGPITSPRDDVPANVLMLSGLSISAASHPMDHFDETAGTVGPGIQLAKRYLENNPTVTRVILVPAAHGGTGYLSYDWNRLDTLYNEAVERINATMTLAKSQYTATGVKLVGIFDIQGEDDWDGGEGIPATTEEFQGWKNRMFRDIRVDIDDATEDTPIVSGGIASEWTSIPAYALQAIEDIGDTVHRWAFASSVSPTVLASDPGDNVHFTADSAVEMGNRLADALAVAELHDYSLPTQPALPSGTLEIHFDATGLATGTPLIERSGNDVKWSGLRTYINSGQIQFGETSIRRRIYIPETEFSPLLGTDFSIHTAFTMSSLASLQGIFGSWYTGTADRSILMRTSGSAIQLYLSGDGTSSTSLAANGVLTAGVEVEVMIQRIGSTVELFVDDMVTPAATATFTGDIHSPASGWMLGDYGALYGSNGSRDFYGSMRYFTLKR